MSLAFQTTKRHCCKILKCWPLLLFSMHSLTCLYLFSKSAYRLALNPVCSDKPTVAFCTVQKPNVIAYSTSMAKCNSASGCQSGQGQNPANCGCAYSYNGKMVFRAPSFKDVADTVKFQELEETLWRLLGLRQGAVFLSRVQFNEDNYLQVQVSLFPSTGTLFNVSEVSRIGFLLSNQTYKPPPIFGPYFFIADQYVPFLGT